MVWLSGRLRWGCRVLSAVPVTVSPSRTAFRAPHCHTCHRQWRHLHQRCQVPHHAPPLASARWVCRWPARHITCWARCRRRWPARHITCWARCRRRCRWPARHMRTPLEVPLQDRRRASARPLDPRRLCQWKPAGRTPRGYVLPPGGNTAYLGPPRRLLGSPLPRPRTTSAVDDAAATRSARPTANRRPGRPSACEVSESARWGVRGYTCLRGRRSRSRVGQSRVSSVAV